jgi:hypothetical protein
MLDVVHATLPATSPDAREVPQNGQNIQQVPLYGTLFAP